MTRVCLPRKKLGADLVPRRLGIASVLAGTVMMAGNTVTAQDMAGTPFESARDYGLDPYLVYSVALTESALAMGNGSIAPWPWTIRSDSSGAFRGNSLEHAQNALSELLASESDTSLDVGLMQINLRWHGNRINDPLSLLDPTVSVHVASQILREAIASSPDDHQLGIGRYHTWRDEQRARDYGSRVLAIYRNLASELQPMTDEEAL